MTGTVTQRSFTPTLAPIGPKHARHTPVAAHDQITVEAHSRRYHQHSPSSTSTPLFFDNTDALIKAASVASGLAKAAPSSVVFGTQDPLEMMHTLSSAYHTKDWYDNLDKNAKAFLSSMSNAVQRTPYPTATSNATQTSASFTIPATYSPQVASIISRIESIASVISTAAHYDAVRHWEHDPLEALRDLVSGACRNEKWYLVLPAEDRAFLEELAAMLRAYMAMTATLQGNKIAARQAEFQTDPLQLDKLRSLGNQVNGGISTLVYALFRIKADNVDDLLEKMSVLNDGLSDGFDEYINAPTPYWSIADWNSVALSTRMNSAVATTMTSTMSILKTPNKIATRGMETVNSDGDKSLSESLNVNTTVTGDVLVSNGFKSEEELEFSPSIHGSSPACCHPATSSPTMLSVVRTTTTFPSTFITSKKIGARAMESSSTSDISQYLPSWMPEAEL
jgi:hypothetical protein